MRARRLLRSGGAIGLLAVLAIAAGCRRNTPERACESFLRAIDEGDAGAVFDSLVETTRWAFYTVQRNHRRMHDLIVETYPPAERPAALARLYSSEADSGRELFIELYPQRYAAPWTARIGHGVASVKKAAARPGELECGRFAGGGGPFRLAQAKSGQWGIAELDAEWSEAQLRAIHDLETVTKNAELYRRLNAPSSQ